jgi:hypothetical protein
MVFASRDVNILHYFSHRHSLRHCPPAVGGEHTVGKTAAFMLQHSAMSISSVQLGTGYCLLQHMFTLLEDSDDTVLHLQLLGFCSSPCQISIVQCRCLPHLFYLILRKWIQFLKCVLFRMPVHVQKPSSAVILTSSVNTKF